MYMPLRCGSLRTTHGSSQGVYNAQHSSEIHRLFQPWICSTESYVPLGQGHRSGPTEAFSSKLGTSRRRLNAIEASGLDGQLTQGQIIATGPDLLRPAPVLYSLRTLEMDRF